MKTSYWVVVLMVWPFWAGTMAQAQDYTCAKWEPYSLVQSDRFNLSITENQLIISDETIIERAELIHKFDGPIMPNKYAVFSGELGHSVFVVSGEFAPERPNALFKSASPVTLNRLMVGKSALARWTICE